MSIDRVEWSAPAMRPTDDALAWASSIRRRAMTHTPISLLRVHGSGSSRVLSLKLEEHNPTGSIKYRTAIGLVAALNEAGPLRPGTRVVESTSGNLGIALATVLAEHDCQFVAVIDPKVPRPVREAVALQGAELVEVPRRDTKGGYLLSRLAMVQQMLDADDQLRWTDQYGSPANPAIHRDTLAVELVEQTGAEIDAVLVAVSTGGTLVGLSAAFRALTPPPAICAVDVSGSLVTGGRPHPHLLTGIGASRPSSFLRRSHYTCSTRVRDTFAFAVCRLLHSDTGFAVGGSGGAVIAAFVRGVQTDASLARARRPVAVIADGGSRYETTVYDDAWLASHGVLDRVRIVEASLRRTGVGFDLVGVAHGG
jgi:cysteine synthase